MSKTQDSFETFYKFNKVNEKSPIVFIHGVGLTHEMWDPQVDFFKDDYNMLAYDLPGHGKTPLNKTNLKFEDYSQQLLNLVNELNGSISAEHGIGIMKKKYLHQYDTKNQIQLLKDIKKTFDPNNILNPGLITN